MQGVRKVLFECPLIPKEIYRYYSPKRKLFMKKVRRSIRNKAFQIQTNQHFNQNFSNPSEISLTEG